MIPRGHSLIAGRSEGGTGVAFTATDPVSGAAIGRVYHAAGSEQVAEAAESARSAFEDRDFDHRRQARLLRALAGALTSHASEIVARAEAETALGGARLEGELARTVVQARLLATEADTGRRRGHAVDPPDGTQPSVIRTSVPIGPVAVFAASNFPLAFGVVGTDTVSALAAGCPVVAKAHPAQPGVADLCGQAMQEAIQACDDDPRMFSLLHDPGHDVGLALVRHEDIEAVAFTGSRRGGEALLAATHERRRPIPVYAEMGSLNPVIVTEAAAQARAIGIADELSAAFQLGGGQFCTKPGLVLVPDSPAGRSLRDRMVERLQEATPVSLLTAQIRQAFSHGLASFEQMHDVVVHRAPPPAAAAIVEVDAGLLDRGSPMLAEVFGPVTVLAMSSAGDVERLLRHDLEAALAISLYFEPDEPVQELIARSVRRSGRVIANQPATGVRVSAAMHHGGPFPATTAPAFTSVGTASIDRFQRAVCLQNMGADLLPGWARP